MADEAKKKKRRGGRKEYSTIQLPKTLIQEVDHIINLETLGYTSRMEFIKDAVRDKILQLQPYLKTKKRKEEKLLDQTRIHPHNCLSRRPQKTKATPQY